MYENPFDFTTGKGHQRPYLTHGAACSEVEIDCLTGQHKVQKWNLSIVCGLFDLPTFKLTSVLFSFSTVYLLFQIIRTDIVNDLGKSLNPAIDVGQIEGAFMILSSFYVLYPFKTSQIIELLNTKRNFMFLYVCLNRAMDFMPRRKLYLTIKEA